MRENKQREECDREDKTIIDTKADRVCDEWEEIQMKKIQNCNRKDKKIVKTK